LHHRRRAVQVYSVPVAPHESGELLYFS
jgi:hypothetical protein